MPLTASVTLQDFKLRNLSFETSPRVFVWDAVMPRLSFHGMRDAESNNINMGHRHERCSTIVKEKQNDGTQREGCFNGISSGW
jgi:hypothetical protein